MYEIRKYPGAYVFAIFDLSTSTKTPWAPIRATFALSSIQHHSSTIGTLIASFDTLPTFAEFQLLHPELLI